MILPGSYANGFSPRDGEPLYPELWQGCVGAWSPSLGPTGSVLRDWSGRQNHGTLTNMDAGTDWTPSGGRWALDFDGVNDGVVVGDPSVLDVTAVTISLWVQFSDSSGVKYILDKQGSAAGYYMYRSTNSLFAGAGNGASYGEIGAAIPGMPDYSRWYHLLYTADALASSLWVDGISIATGAGKVVAANTSSLAFAQFTSGGFNCACKLDDIRVYGRSMKQNEIRLLATRRGIAHELTPIRYSGETAGFLAAWRRQQSFIIGGGLQ